MARGLPLAYIKKWGISKLAWSKFRQGALTKGVPTRTAAIKRRLKGKNPKKKVKSMAKRRRFRRRGGMTIPLAVVAPLAYGVGEPVKWMAMDGMPIEEGLKHLLIRYTGYNAWSGRFDPLNSNGLAKGMFPLIVGALVHKFVGGRPLNVNAMLARAKVPFVRI